MESIVGEQFTDMCEALGLQQHVTQSTHISGHILDLVIAKYDNSFVIDQIIHDTYFLDHNALIIKNKIPRTPMIECATKFRNWKKVSILELGEKLYQLNWDGIDNDTDLDDALEYFVTKLNEALEDVIPEKTAKVKTHRSQPWISKILKTSKKYTRNCERVWWKYKQLHQPEAFKVARNKYFRLIHVIRKGYYQEEFMKHKGDSKAFYNLFQNWQAVKKTTILIDQPRGVEPAEEFSKFFSKRL